MADLSTKYMGLGISNPLVVASSGLTATLEGVRNAAQAGAGAVVLKSIFEEQIETEVDDMAAQTWIPAHPESIDYVRQMGLALTPAKYLDLIARSKNEVDIPVIASLNCVSPRWWANYAAKIADAGADALELNISIMPSDARRKSDEIENIHYHIVESVRKKISIPLAVKIGPRFTAMARFAGELSARGADALVLFNRFYRFDVDISTHKLVPAYPFSTSEEMGASMRWISLLAGRVDADLAASTGIHDGTDVIKMILVGAAATQLSSTLYQNGLEQIGVILDELTAWMDENGYENLSGMRGKLSQAESENPEYYERLQYIKAVVGME